ncbi:MAG: hypothetical protein ACRCWY_01370 [Cellulosilyticaceae bacterium]
MDTWMIWTLVAVFIAALAVGLFFWGKKLQKKYDEQQQLINQHKQAVQLFVIDKKKDTINNLKLPKQVKDQIPKMQRKRKMPVVIVKVGPQIQTLLCDESVYNSIPVKKQIRAELAGIMLVNVLSGKLPETKKVGFMEKMKRKAKSIQNNK